jgi:type VI secretion system protein ImpM
MVAAMSATVPRTGFVGPLPHRAGLVDIGLDAGVLTRWDLWFELVSGRGLPERLHPDRPAWRLMAREGIFDAEPVAGCFRLGQDRPGRVYPCAVLRLGPLPDPLDPWYDAAEALARGATAGHLSLRETEQALHGLPAPATLAPPLDGAATFWRDDWEVRELRFATGADLARFPLSLAAEPDLGEEAA